LAFAGSVLSSATVSAREGRLAGSVVTVEPMIARTPSQDSVTPAGPSGRPCRSAWKTPSIIRAMCSARETLRPSQ
jgi:hypothetical protein